MSETMTQENQRLDAASEWLMRLQEDSLSDEELVRWVEWCEEHSDNRKAFESLLPLWQAFDDRDPRFLTQALEKRSVLAPGRRGRRDVAAPLYSWNRRTAITALAASVTLILGAVLLLTRPDRLDGIDILDPIATLQSQPGRIRPAVLPDGSKLDLGARSVVAIDFTGLRRQIEMQDGEAYFTVNPDRKKPFVVRVGAVSVTAVGTQFNVQKSGARVVVTVSEGSVRLDSSSPSAGSLLAPAGYQVTFDGEHAAKPLMRAVDAGAATAWRQGRLEYLSEPLSAVVATLNRYSDREITLQDPALARLNYTGTIEVESVEEWIEALPRIFPVQILGGPDEQLRIVPRT